MKYDDASWHLQGNFPADLSDLASATHIGMYAMWAWSNGLGGESYIETKDEFDEAMRTRKIMPGRLFLQLCDGKLTDEDFNENGNAFTQEYFNDNAHGYIDDYKKCLGTEKETIYHIKDNWENFEKISFILREKFLNWKN
jgi:hypothetical protein